MAAQGRDFSSGPSSGPWGRRYLRGTLGLLRSVWGCVLSLGPQSPSVWLRDSDRSSAARAVLSRCIPGGVRRFLRLLCSSFSRAHPVSWLLIPHLVVSPRDVGFVSMPPAFERSVLNVWQTVTGTVSLSLCRSSVISRSVLMGRPSPSRGCNPVKDPASTDASSVGLQLPSHRPSFLPACWARFVLCGSCLLKIIKAEALSTGRASPSAGGNWGGGLSASVETCLSGGICSHLTAAFSRSAVFQGFHTRLVSLVRSQPALSLWPLSPERPGEVLSSP